MGWFHFKGKDSRDFGILISAAPEKVRAERRVEQVTIPGRNGDLTVDEGTYAPYVISVECSTRGSENLDEILAWLNGAGDLILCTEPDKVFRASIYNKISVADMICLYNSFLLQFRVQPFKYSVNAAGDALELTAPTTIRNSGTVYSEPLITVYGSGDITLTINGADFPLYGVQESITIDSEMMEVFKGNANQNGKYGGAEFPRFEVGKNEISWTGNVSKIKIQPRWRWL